MLVPSCLCWRQKKYLGYESLKNLTMALISPVNTRKLPLKATIIPRPRAQFDLTNPQSWWLYLFAFFLLFLFVYWRVHPWVVPTFGLSTSTCVICASSSRRRSPPTMTRPWPTRRPSSLRSISRPWPLMTPSEFSTKVSLAVSIKRSLFRCCENVKSSNHFFLIH